MLFNKIQFKSNVVSKCRNYQGLWSPERTRTSAQALGSHQGFRYRLKRVSEISLNSRDTMLLWRAASLRRSDCRGAESILISSSNKPRSEEAAAPQTSTPQAAFEQNFPQIHENLGSFKKVRLEPKQTKELFLCDKMEAALPLLLNKQHEWLEAVPQKRNPLLIFFFSAAAI